MPPRQKKKKTLEEEHLDELIDQDITVFLSNGTALKGKMVDYDVKSICLRAPGEADATLVQREHISTYKRGLVEPKARKK